MIRTSGRAREDLAEASGKPVQVVSVLDCSSRALLQSDDVGSRREKPAQRLSQAFRRSRLGQIPGYPISHQLWNACDTSSDESRSARRCFYERVRQAFRVAVTLNEAGLYQSMCLIEPHADVGLVARA